MNTEQAKQIPIEDFLLHEGFLPEKTVNNEKWYRRPFGQNLEKEASFKLSSNGKMWNDFGLGQGGNIIDLVCMMHKCNVSEALKKLSQISKTHNILASSRNYPIINQVSNNLTVNSISDISDPVLLNYILSRKVDIKIVSRFAKEINYTVNGNTYKSIGIPNIAKGWELTRPHDNSNFKNSTSPKSISYFHSNSKEIVVFEGMFDLFSLVQHSPELTECCDFIVLNSVALKAEALNLLRSYKMIHLFLDNDNAGNEAADYFIRNASNEIINHANEYLGFNDLNEFIQKHK